MSTLLPSLLEKDILLSLLLSYSCYRYLCCYVFLLNKIKLMLIKFGNQTHWKLPVRLCYFWTNWKTIERLEFDWFFLWFCSNGYVGSIWKDFSYNPTLTVMHTNSYIILQTQTTVMNKITKYGVIQKSCLVFLSELHCSGKLESSVIESFWSFRHNNYYHLLL